MRDIKFGTQKRQLTVLLYWEGHNYYVQDMYLIFYLILRFVAWQFLSRPTTDLKINFNCLLKTNSIVFVHCNWCLFTSCWSNCIWSIFLTECSKEIWCNYPSMDFPIHSEHDGVSWYHLVMCNTSERAYLYLVTAVFLLIRYTIQSKEGT